MIVLLAERELNEEVEESGSSIFLLAGTSATT